MPATRTARSPRRVAARDVRHADGARSLLPAVDLVFASAVTACRCAACSAPIAARAEHVIASRSSDTNGVFDVAYCTLACRARFVGGAR